LHGPLLARDLPQQDYVLAEADTAQADLVGGDVGDLQYGERVDGGLDLEVAAACR
jgi:hypothetical protein